MKYSPDFLKRDANNSNFILFNSKNVGNCKHKKSYTKNEIASHKTISKYVLFFQNVIILYLVI